MCFIRTSVTGGHPRGFDGVKNCVSTVECELLITVKRFTPQPLNDGAICVASMNVERVPAARRAEHVCYLL